MNQWTCVCEGTELVFTTNVDFTYSLGAFRYLLDRWDDLRILRAFREMGEGG